MKSILNVLVVITMLLSYTTGIAQIKNSTTETVKIYGNCGMCEKTIEKAGNVKKVASVDWNQDTQMATLTYDANKTSKDEILKRIALAGYDSDSFLAPDDVYANLHGCCQYDRVAKPAEKTEGAALKTESADNAEHQMTMETQKSNQLTSVFDNYFELKDALVKTDGAMAAGKSKDLLSSIKSVKMDKLETDVHNVWMKVLKDLQEDAANIADSKDVARQRDQFMSLSKNMYELMKVSKYEQPVYYQFCPMADNGKGANWLSKENAVKNPYYGSQMMSCGKTVETIK